MSIRPIDLQVSIQRSTDINRTTNNETQKPEVAQQQFTQRLQKEVEHDNQQVVHSNRSEGRNVDKDGKGSSYEDSANKKKKRNSSVSAKSAKNNTSLLDVSI